MNGLPAASVDITDYRAIVEPLQALRRRNPISLIVFIVALVGLITAVIMLARTGVLPGDDPVLPVAIGIVGTAVLVAVCLVLPAQLAARTLAARNVDADLALENAIDRVTSTLADIGYLVPRDVARAWVRSADSGATVPLVHDSVIAARWWRPAAGDDRVFVEAVLAQEGAATALPVLPPLG